jgi:hypothetical protein
MGGQFRAAEVVRVTLAVEDRHRGVSAHVVSAPRTDATRKRQTHEPSGESPLHRRPPGSTSIGARDNQPRQATARLAPARSSMLRSPGVSRLSPRQAIVDHRSEPKQAILRCGAVINSGVANRNARAAQALRRREFCRRDGPKGRSAQQNSRPPPAPPERASPSSSWEPAFPNRNGCQ